MKTNRFFLLAASLGLLLSPSRPAHAQAALKTDTTGNLTDQSLLNLGSPRITGTLAPLHLGTGTPSSATVLRGDGTWAATTPTGNTLAATTSLLMGDGAGNAAAVASSADLQNVLQLRAQTARALTTIPANLLGSANLVIRNATLNADGTLTIPANDYIQYNPPVGDTYNVPHYCYAAATRDVPVGKAGGFYITAYYNGYGNDDFDIYGGVYSTPQPATSKFTFTNSSNGQYQVCVINHTSAPVTIYPPVATTADVGLLPIPTYNDSPLASQPVADFDFTRFASEDRTSRYLAERQTTLAVDSVNGANANAGTLYAPRLTLADQTVVNGATVGLYRGSFFRDSLPFGSLSSPHGIVVQDVALGSVKPLPVISALDPVATGSVTSNGDGTYSYLWTPTDSTIANDGYQNVYVVEINTATEAATPVASRRRMVDVTSQAAASAGAVYVLPPGTGAGQSGSTTQWKAIFHPSDSLAPGSGSYRYEVVSRFCPAQWGPQGTVGDGAMNGLELVGSSNGYGCLSGPTGFVGDRLAFLHATTHNAVIGGGSLQRSVFYESGDTVSPGPSIQLAWYTGTATGLRWAMNHCLFYMNVGDRYANGVISHTGGSTSYDRGDIADTAFLGARWSNGSLQGTAIDYVNVATGTINRVYVQAIKEILGVNMPLGTEVKNSVFRQVHLARIGVNFHDNIVLAESGSDATDANNRGPVGCLLQQNGASATNNLFWARGLPSGISNDDAAGGISDNGATTGTIQRNIFVLNPASTSTVPAQYIQLPSSAGFAIDYNLIINLAKGGFAVAAGNGNALSWADYRSLYPTLDPHSLYLDLSADPRGIKAVFVDPLNGDFRWAQTDVARQCAAFCAANHVGPASVTSRWPVVPTVDEAVRLLTSR